MKNHKNQKLAITMIGLLLVGVSYAAPCNGLQWKERPEDLAMETNVCSSQMGGIRVLHTPRHMKQSACRSSLPATICVASTRTPNKTVWFYQDVIACPRDDQEALHFIQNTVPSSTQQSTSTYTEYYDSSGGICGGS